MKVYKIVWDNAARDYGYLYGEETLKAYDIRFKKIREIRMPRPEYAHAVDDLVEDIRFLMDSRAPEHVIAPLLDLAKKWMFSEEEKQDAYTHNN